MNPSYTYKATVQRVVDGDTVDLCIDLGFRLTTQLRVRLAGIDAPEVSTAEGKQVRDVVRGLLPPGLEVIAKTSKSPEDKYGRWMGVIVMADGTVLNDLLIREGHAKPYDGGKR